MATLLLHVDAFTSTAFSGNPAAVCLLPPPSTDAWKQQLAAEMNLSETAFVEALPAHVNANSEAGTNAFSLRWFTPADEVPLCGHATLAGAHALWQEGLVPREAAITFKTLSGLLRASCVQGGITLDFPAIVATELPVPASLEAALGARIVRYAETATKLLAELENEQAVRELQPDMAQIARLPKEGVIVTARAQIAGSNPVSGILDFVSRFFAPRLGVPEDPVTGSSHSILGPWWRARLQAEDPDKQEFRAAQVGRRGGGMMVRVAGDRVFLTGQAVTVARGQLLALPPG